MLKNVVHNNQQNSSFSLCDVIMQKFHSFVKEINFMFMSTLLLYCRKLGAWSVDENKILYVGLDTRKNVIFDHLRWGSLGANMNIYWQ